MGSLHEETKTNMSRNKIHSLASPSKPNSIPFSKSNPYRLYQVWKGNNVIISLSLSLSLSLSQNVCFICFYQWFFFFLKIYNSLFCLYGIQELCGICFVSFIMSIIFIDDELFIIICHLGWCILYNLIPLRQELNGKFIICCHFSFPFYQDMTFVYAVAEPGNFLWGPVNTF